MQLLNVLLDFTNIFIRISNEIRLYYMTECNKLSQSKYTTLTQGGKVENFVKIVVGFY